MKIHGAAMLAYLAFLGSLWTHIRRGFGLRANRLSGSIVIAANVILIFSGWILYYGVEEIVREWNSVIYWSLGLAALPLLFGHTAVGRKNHGLPEETGASEDADLTN